MGVLKKAREKKGWSQEQTARKLDIAYFTYNRAENGKYKPSVKLAMKMGRLLDFPWYLIYEENDGTLQEKETD